MTAPGAPESFAVRRASCRGSEIAPKATGRVYSSLGEGIVNTLAADLEGWEAGVLAAQALGTAALERKASSLNAS